MCVCVCVCVGCNLEQVSNSLTHYSQQITNGQTWDRLVPWTKEILPHFHTNNECIACYDIGVQVSDTSKTKQVKCLEPGLQLLCILGKVLKA